MKLYKVDLYYRYLFFGAGILLAVGLLNIELYGTAWYLLLLFAGCPTLGYLSTEAVKYVFGKLGV